MYIFTFMEYVNAFELPEDSCVYAIICLNTEQFYIGSSLRGGKKRFKEHSDYLAKRKHANFHLQNAYDNKFQLIFIPFLLISQNQLLIKEQEYLDLFFDKGIKCMNLLPKAFSWLGYKHTQESKDKISRANKGRKLPGVSLSWKTRIVSQATREKLSIARKGKSIPNKRKGLPGKPHTIETKEKLSKLNKKYYDLISPNGILIKIFGIVDFANKNELDAGALIKVAKGKQKQHKGWKCFYSS